MHSKTLLAGLAVLSLVGCGGSAKVSLSARAGAKPTPAPVAPIASSAQPLTLANGIELDRVRFAIRRLKLEPTATTGTTSGSSTESGESEPGEFSVGPFIVDLQGAALDGGINQVFDAEVPVGTYHEVRFEIHRLESASGFDPVWSTASILIDGKVDGAPFTFSSGLDEELQRESRVAVEPGQNNITFNIDPTGWFVSTSGGRLDPRESSSRSEIENNIKSSIDTLEDDDHDGHEDADDGSETGDVH